MDEGREDVKSDTPPKCIGSAVLGECFHEDEECADGIVSQKERQEDLPHPDGEGSAHDGSRLFQTGGDIRHGISQECQHEGEKVQAHDEDETA